MNVFAPKCAICGLPFRETEQTKAHPILREQFRHIGLTNCVIRLIECNQKLEHELDIYTLAVKECLENLKKVNSRPNPMAY
jgi:hypothetical protein